MGHLIGANARDDIGATTAWRYIREAVDLLAAAALTLTRAMVPIARLAYLAAPWNTWQAPRHRARSTT